MVHAHAHHHPETDHHASPEAARLMRLAGYASVAVASVLLIAKHRDAAARLGRTFQTRSAAKTYWALVRGEEAELVTDENVAWFAARGPGSLVQRIRIPTLFIQGTGGTISLEDTLKVVTPKMIEEKLEEVLEPGSIRITSYRKENARPPSILPSVYGWTMASLPSTERRRSRIALSSSGVIGLAV